MDDEEQGVPSEKKEPSPEWAAHLEERRALYAAVGLNTEGEHLWYDADTIMLHAMMKCLELYIYESGGVEKLAAFTNELGLEDPADDPSGGVIAKQTNSQSEALAIWHWWSVDRVADEAKYEAALERFYGWCRKDYQTLPEEDKAAYRADYEAWRALEASKDAREPEMLERLLRIRGSLWT